MSTLNEKQQDGELVRRIREQIKWDKRLSLADFDVVINNGVAIINGYVDTSFKKTAAIEAVSKVEGVWEIEDRIVVPPDYFRSDQEIRQILESQISEFIKLSGEHVEVDVLDGVVKLKGEVYRPRLKAMAVAAAWELSGVADVLNLIEIHDPPQRVSIVVEAAYDAIFPSDGELKTPAGDLMKEVS